MVSPVSPAGLVLRSQQPGRYPGSTPRISPEKSARRKLSPRLASSLGAYPERRGDFSCGGLQPSELSSPALKVGTDPARSIGSVRGYRS